MRRTLIIMISLCFLLPNICLAQFDSDASKSADKFLKGIKLFDLPEGKEMLSLTQWEKPAYNNYPFLQKLLPCLRACLQPTFPKFKGISGC